MSLPRIVTQGRDLVAKLVDAEVAEVENFERGNTAEIAAAEKAVEAARKEMDQWFEQLAEKLQELAKSRSVRQ